MLVNNIAEMFDRFEVWTAPNKLDVMGFLYALEFRNEFKVFVEISITAPAESQQFYRLAQNRVSNLLQKKLVDRQEDFAVFDMMGNKTIAAKDFKLFIKGYREIGGVTSTAAILLDCLMIAATIQGLQDTLVRLPLKEYMLMRGLSDIKESRQQVRRDINALERVSFEYKGEGKQRGAWLTVKISGGTMGQIKNGDIIFRFNQDFFDSFKSYVNRAYLFMYFPIEALKGSIRHNPYKYWLARKISEHKRMNLGKPNENVLRVQTLINACPNFPTYEQTNRNAINRIIAPFERDMNALNSVFTWEYVGGVPADYDEFLAASIKIYWNNYPDKAVGDLKARKSERKPKNKGG